MLRAFQWDLARQVERLDHLLGLLPRYAEWGYSRLYLHLEDAVDYPSLPGVARADAYPWRDLETLVSTAQRHGIGVVPIANLLGHTQYLIKTAEWRDLNELRDPATGAALPVGQICPLHSRTPELAARLIGDLAPLCTAGEIHVGLDESFHLGKHPLSRAEIAEVGLAAHFACHVARLHALASARGLRLGLWADMLALLPEAIPLLEPLSRSREVEGSRSPQTTDALRHSASPRRSADLGSSAPRPLDSSTPSPGLVAYDWYYHPFARLPRMELYNFSEYDLAPALRAAGIAWWACPMNGAFRHEVAPVWGERMQNLAAWWRRAHAAGAEGFLVTSWEPYRLALPTTTLMDAAAATLWLQPALGDDPATLLAAGLRRYTTHPTRSDCHPLGDKTPSIPSVPTPAHCHQIGDNLPGAPSASADLRCNPIGDIGSGAADAKTAVATKSWLSNVHARALARGLLASDALAFAGNSRWEINSRWDSVGPRRESALPHAAAARHLARLASRCAQLATVAPPLAPLAATLRFQSYLAARDVFVRRATSGAARLRRLAAKQAKPESVTQWVTSLQAAAAEFSVALLAARRDARAMWIASRPAATFAASQNAAVLAGDAARLRAWQAWLRAVARRLGHARRASPVLGRWTLRFTVHHFAPAWQKVVVEQLQPDGAWREIYGRVTIEFRARAARPHPRDLRLEFACPVDDPDAPLRIATRCVGQVAISHIELTDGVSTRVHAPPRTRHVLGEPAPKSGWPRVDWQRNTSELPLAWGG